MLPSSIKPRSNSAKVVNETFIKKLDFTNFKTLKQKEVYEDFTMDMLQKDFYNKYNSIGKKLLEYGAFERYYQEKKYEIINKEKFEPKKTLTVEQNRALLQIKNSGKMISLLFGITGSGKTEIYLQLAEEYLNDNRQVLILVPEISLTPQMVQRVKARFQDNIAIYHSGLNAQEKYYQYKKVKDGDVKIVVGTRSSIFMPFVNLGLIIIDEEHDGSYKQDNVPCYHVRDVAVLRAKKHDSKILLASATPSLDSFARALKNVYTLVNLNSRISKHELDVTVVDMKEELKNGQSTILSYQLQEAIDLRLEKNEQVIVLLNRRGYTPIFKCNNCDESLKCPHCDVALTYHKDIRKLKCHVCDYTVDIPKVCPKCNHQQGFSTFGFGVQKLEEELCNFYPNAKVVRMDADTTRVKNGHQKILERFEKHEIDILCGTQMLAKGLDYPEVTLVGIVNADAGLSRVDYRSCEICFDLINQASGRSGRALKKGEVILQVFNPDHYIIDAAIKNDYQMFYKNEMQYRHQAFYPPYSFLVAVYFSDINEDKVDKSASYFKNLLNNNDIKVLGPSKLLKLRNYYRDRIIIKSKNLELMKKLVREAIKEYNNSNQVSVKVDVNPLFLE
jgi:primosomal protein N' (replication factor Y)